MSKDTGAVLFPRKKVEHAAGNIDKPSLGRGSENSIIVNNGQYVRKTTTFGMLA